MLYDPNNDLILKAAPASLTERIAYLYEQSAALERAAGVHGGDVSSPVPEDGRPDLEVCQANGDDAGQIRQEALARAYYYRREAYHLERGIPPPNELQNSDVSIHPTPHSTGRLRGVVGIRPRSSERMERRRDYLKRRRQVSAHRMLWGAMFLSGMAVLIDSLIHYQSGMPWWWYVLVVGMMIASCLQTAWTNARLSREAASIPYVPPATPDTLPAEEVLVRGAEEPSAPGETLLRPTTGSNETPVKELLRSSRINSDTLPVEEIFVRGTEEPSEPTETLLRAATTVSEETPAEQLLRPTNTDPQG